MRRTAQLIAMSAAVSGPAHGTDDALRARGEALFRGNTPLEARIAGHGLALPPQAAACIQCHGRDRPGPALSDGWLRQVQSRRNGPPGNYDADAMCHTLRTGIDPVQVVLPREMPRFDISDTDCHALWIYFDIPAESP